MKHRDTFETFCARFGSPVPAHVVRIGKRIFHDPHNLHRFATEHRIETFSAGVFLGEEKGGFRPTIALVDMVAPHCKSVVTVSDKAAWLFLCGRDVLMDGVVSVEDCERDGVAIVKDIEENVLGFGTVMAEWNTRQKGRVLLKHTLDRGEYLRRER